LRKKKPLVRGPNLSVEKTAKKEGQLMGKSERVKTADIGKGKRKLRGRKECFSASILVIC